MFLLCLLCYPAPQRNFEIAFKMFDLNGDGEVDLEEFEQVGVSSAVCPAQNQHIKEDKKLKEPEAQTLGLCLNMHSSF